MFNGVIRSSDWKRAAKNSEFAEYIRNARARFDRGEAATVKKIRALYRRVANQLRQEVESLTPGTLRRSHLSALAKVLDQMAGTLDRETMKAIRSGVGLAMNEAVRGAEQLTLDLMDGFVSSAEIRAMFAAVNQRAVMDILSRTYHDGLKLSDRVWRTSRNARRAIERLVEDAIVRGLDARTLARHVERYLQPGVGTAFKDETRRRLKVPRDVSMEAMRLAVTEMQHSFHEGTVQAYRHVPSCRGFYWRLLAVHTVPDICNDYATRGGDGFWEKGLVPVKPHPWCRCVLIPVMEDPGDFVQRLKKWVKDPQSQTDLQNWYKSMAKEFVARPKRIGTTRRRVHLHRSGMR
jgi:hypothetical protein